MNNNVQEIKDFISLIKSFAEINKTEYTRGYITACNTVINFIENSIQNDETEIQN